MTDIRNSPSGVLKQASGGGIQPPAGQIDGTADDPLIVGLTESGGAELDIGSISDGQFLRRVGASILGVSSLSILSVTSPLTLNVGTGELSVNPVSNISSGVAPQHAGVADVGKALIATAAGSSWGTDFGSQSLITTGNLSLGATPATAGVIRVSYGSIWRGRNVDNTADLKIFENGVGGLVNNLGFGDGNSTSTLIDGGSLTVRIGAGLTSRFTVTATVSNFNVPNVYFRNTATDALFNFEDVTGATVADLKVRSQGTTQAATAGTYLRLQGGRAGAGGLMGGASLDLNVDNSTFHRVVQVANVTGSLRVVALCRSSLITTAQAPANSGDLVVNVGDAASVPSADATAGHVYYSDSGRPGWRFNATNFRFNGTSASASAGAGGALPATVEGYLDVQINGTQRKIPYYAA